MCGFAAHHVQRITYRHYSYTAFEKPSVVQLEQIFTIDKSRIQRFLGQTTRREMRRIEEALLNSLEINEWDRRNADE